MHIVAVTDYELVPPELYKRCDDCRQPSPKRWECKVNDYGTIMTFWLCESCREKHQLRHRTTKRKNPLALR